MDKVLPGHESLAAFIEELIRMFSCIVYLQTIFFLCEDLAFVFVAPAGQAKMIPLGLFIFHSPFIYAFCCFRSWTMNNTRENRSALGRATKVMLAASILLWIAAVGAQVNICI